MYIPHRSRLCCSELLKNTSTPVLLCFIFVLIKILDSNVICLNSGLMGLCWTMQHCINVVLLSWWSCGKGGFYCHKQVNFSPQFVCSYRTRTLNILCLYSILQVVEIRLTTAEFRICNQTKAEWEMAWVGVSKVMWYGERYVSDVTVVEIWKIGGWETDQAVRLLKWHFETCSWWRQVVMLWNK